MVDISLCPGTGCPLRDSCRRYTARPGNPLGQSWIGPVSEYRGGRCDWYLPTPQTRWRE